MRSASAGAEASTRSARAAKCASASRNGRRRHALLGGDVVHAVVDDRGRLERLDEPVRLRHVAPQDRPLEAERARGAADLGAQQARVEAPEAAAPVERDHERRQHVQAVDRARPRRRALHAARHPAQVAARQARLAQPERLQEQHPVAARQARHQVLLVGPQLGVPLAEAEADDVAAARAVTGWPPAPGAPPRPGRCRGRARRTARAARAGAAAPAAARAGPHGHERVHPAQLRLGVERADQPQRRQPRERRARAGRRRPRAGLSVTSATSAPAARAARSHPAARGRRLSSPEAIASSRTGPRRTRAWA